ncbi:type II toxin-antitoxin system RelB/DinJ family antitoxin [Treponema zioleckii]|uniref:type II toxin-antitoxin system RelB/DinJ family antitoxin n=1 Tax=Treponema zioleckii TaxID=331680 RepID=UPI00168B17E9|nr:type II toxin-antitoxin system RelB/DinJ family antitoxin [Treponema zioleckii]
MSKKEFTFSIDERLANKATELFEQLGMTLDSAVNIFISQAVLRRGLPFQIVMPENADEKTEIKEAKPEEPKENSQADETTTESNECEEAKEAEKTEETCVAKTESAQAEEPTCSAKENEQPSTAEVSFVTPEIAARVAANETLVAEMRGSLESSDCTPEFEENEEAELAKKQEIAGNTPKTEAKPTKETESKNENIPADATEQNSENADTVDEDEEEDQNLPDNIFDCWE